MRRSQPPRRRRRWLKRGKPPRQVSEKKAATLDRRREVRVMVLARDGGCRGRLIVPEVQCMGMLDPDEIVSRGRRPGGELDVDNVQMLCRAHHDWKHAHSVEAERRGLGSSDGGNPEWAQAKEELQQRLNARGDYGDGIVQP